VQFTVGGVKVPRMLRYRPLVPPAPRRPPRRLITVVVSASAIRCPVCGHSAAIGEAARFLLQHLDCAAPNP
jgi:hypothetical protein